MTPALAAKPQTTLTSYFNLQQINDDFYSKGIQDRLTLIHDWFTDYAYGNLALSSSFGVQSALLLHYAQESSLNIPVVSVDIAESKYDGQRAYRRHLQEKLGFTLLSFPAASDADKVRAMDTGLHDHFITATISGIRASQTEERAQKNFVEWNARNQTLSFHPLLDWPDSKTEFYLEKHIAPELRHPNYSAGLRSKGGVILGADEAKTECGLHIERT